MANRSKVGDGNRRAGRKPADLERDEATAGQLRDGERHRRGFRARIHEDEERLAGGRAIGSAAPQERHARTGGANHAQSVGPQRRVGMPQRDEVAERGAERLVAPGCSDGERAAAVRVVAALDPDLVAVVDAWRARQCHLEQHSQPDRGDVARDQRPQARHVVGGEQVQLRGDRRRRVRRGLGENRRREHGRVRWSNVHRELVVGRDERGVERGPTHEPEDRLEERVVHQGVEPVAADPARRDIPDLPHQVCVGVHGPATPTELLPEHLVVDLGGDVQPPSVDPEPQPVLRDRPQELADGRMVRVELRQGRHVPPGPVPELVDRRAPRRLRTSRVIRARSGAIRIRIQAPAGRQPFAVQVEPVHVRRREAILQHVVERPEAPPGVVEDAVEHDPHSPGMERVHQLSQRGRPAEERVDGQVVVGMVPVVRRRAEDGSQIEGGDAELGELVEVLDDPQEVAALEPVAGWRRVPCLEGSGGGDARRAREPIREDLVEDGVTDPARRGGRHGPTRARGRAVPADGAAPPVSTTCQPLTPPMVRPEMMYF